MGGRREAQAEGLSRPPAASLLGPPAKPTPTRPRVLDAVAGRGGAPPRPTSAAAARS